MNGAAVADYRHVVGEDDFADDRDGATDEDADVAGPKNFGSSESISARTYQNSIRLRIDRPGYFVQARHSA